MKGLLKLRPILMGAAALLLACVPGILRQQTPVLHGYLIGYLFWTGLSLGSLGLLLLNHTAGGRWGIVIRRPLEAAAGTLPLCALLFLPILFGSHGLYEWTHAADDAHIQKISAYLNLPFFAIRSVVYYAIWIGLWAAVRRLSVAQDAGRDVSSRLTKIGAPGLLLFVLSVTFAFTDWMMSLEPHWFSTLYGAMVLTGHGAGAMAASIILVNFLKDEPEVGRLAHEQRSHELGNLLLAFVMLWAYLSFSQYLLIWSANVAEEVPWVMRRQTGGWQWLAIVLVIVHFAGPFFILLSRNVKRVIPRLAAVAGVVLVARWFDLLWLVGPALRPDGFKVGWADVVATIGIGGLWSLYFIARLSARRLVPVGDPRMAEAVK